MQTYFTVQKLLGGDAKISITLSYLKIIKFCLARKCR